MGEQVCHGGAAAIFPEDKKTDCSAIQARNTSALCENRAQGSLASVWARLTLECFDCLTKGWKDNCVMVRPINANLKKPIEEFGPSAGDDHGDPYRIELSQTERSELTALLSGGKQAARKLKRAQILLAADAGVSDDDIATSVGVGGSSRLPDQAALRVRPWRQAERSARPGASRKLSARSGEALLVATARSKPPEGRARWTLELLAGELVQAHHP